MFPSTARSNLWRFRSARMSQTRVPRTIQDPTGEHGVDRGVIRTNPTTASTPQVSKTHCVIVAAAVLLLLLFYTLFNAILHTLTPGTVVVCYTQGKAIESCR